MLLLLLGGCVLAGRVAGPATVDAASQDSNVQSHRQGLGKGLARLSAAPSGGRLHVAGTTQDALGGAAAQMNVTAGAYIRNQEGTCWRLENRKYLHSVFPYKAGSSEWLRLQVLALSGKWIKNPHWPPWRREVESVLRYTPSAIAAAGGELIRILIVRSPYERMLSAYMDKVVKVTHGHLQLAPRSMQRNGSFAEFVRLAIAERTPRSWLAAAHYGPLTKWWQETTITKKEETSCTVKPNATPNHSCWLGFPNTMRILKLDLIDTWYADLVHTLGWEDKVNDGRWAGGCFYRPQGTTCETALGAPSSPGNETCVRGRHVGQTSSKTCVSMAEHYTPEIASAVTEYARDDLVRFGYPVWHGDVAQPWY